MKRSTALVILVTGVILEFAPQRTWAGPPNGYGLVWSDEFSGSSLDTSKWTARTGQGRDDTYTTNAVTVSGGVMTLKTYTEGGVHYDGWVDTQNKYLSKQGYYEARINFHTTDGMWSAFWLQSPGMHPYSGTKDPAINGAEIDIQEHRANDGNANDLHSAIHWGGYDGEPNNPDPSSDSKHTTGLGTGMGNDQWHTYALLWNDNSYTFYFDDVAKWTTSSGLSNALEYMILSSEVQNNSWAGDIPSGGYGSLATSTTDMQVDYVRVYALPEPGAMSVATGFLLLVLGRRNKRT